MSVRKLENSVRPFLNHHRPVVIRAISYHAIYTWAHYFNPAGCSRAALVSARALYFPEWPQFNPAVKLATFLATCPLSHLVSTGALWAVRYGAEGGARSRGAWLTGTLPSCRGFRNSQPFFIKP